MNRSSTSVTESQPDGFGRPGSGTAHAPDSIRITKTILRSDGHRPDMEVLGMALGEERIQLVPLKSWGQLDAHKWVQRGKLPDSPAGLEVTADHVKLLGQTVAVNDPEACFKLENLFAEWLEMEKETAEMARKKAAAHPPEMSKSEVSTIAEPPHYVVELDKSGHAHIKYVQGRETVAVIGLNQAGFKSFFNQGLMRKPHVLQVGALHDWVELDGVLFSFEKGNDDSQRLQRFLNEGYLPPNTGNADKDILIYGNAASSTGFDIQFPVMVGGVPDHRRRPLNDESLELLQDPVKCGLLHKGLVIKLIRPTLVFKQKTSDGGEHYLESCPQNLVRVTDEDGKETLIDLSHPVKYMHLSTSEMAAVFNHPAIHKHGRVAPNPTQTEGARPGPTATGSVRSSGGDAAKDLPIPEVSKPSIGREKIEAETGAERMSMGGEEKPRMALVSPQAEDSTKPLVTLRPRSTVTATESVAVAPTTSGLAQPQLESLRPSIVDEPPPRIEFKPAPNAWLAPTLERPAIRHDWFACLVYSRIAEELGNSSTGMLGQSHCWSAAMGEVEEISDPAFKGFFLTEKHGFGFLNEDHIVKFGKGVAFVGLQGAAIEGIGVELVGVAMDAEQRVYFIVKEGYRGKFGLPEGKVSQECARLKEHGAEILSVKEALGSSAVLEVVWTVPAELSAGGEPLVQETRRSECLQPVEAHEPVVRT